MDNPPNKFINWKAEWAETVFYSNYSQKNIFQNPFTESHAQPLKIIYIPRNKFFAKKCKKEFSRQEKM